jgi:CsoR family transcriptional regulator, copper-sensing transcriptional repressor
MPTSTKQTRGYTATKDQLQNRLRRIEGQVRGVSKMVDEDRWCPDVLVQIAAIRAALDKVALGLAEGHVQHCISEAAGGKKRREAMTAELMSALGQLVR